MTCLNRTFRCYAVQGAISHLSSFFFFFVDSVFSCKFQSLYLTITAEQHPSWLAVGKPVEHNLSLSMPSVLPVAAVYLPESISRWWWTAKFTRNTHIMSPKPCILLVSVCVCLVAHHFWFVSSNDSDHKWHPQAFQKWSMTTFFNQTVVTLDKS